METNTAIRITALGTVFQIAFYRATDSRQLTTDLMVTSGLKVDFQKRVVFAINEGFVI